MEIKRIQGYIYKTLKISAQAGHPRSRHGVVPVPERRDMLRFWRLVNGRPNNPRERGDGRQTNRRGTLVVGVSSRLDIQI